jgi:hypothetical protein
VNEFAIEKDVIGVALWPAIQGAIEELQRRPKRHRAA